MDRSGVGKEALVIVKGDNGASFLSRQDKVHQVSGTVSRSDDLRDGDDSCSRDDDLSGSANENELRAILSGAGDIEGEAEFESEDGSKKFKVKIEDAAPNQRYSVYLEGVGDPIVELTTDGRGDARVEIFRASFPISEGTELTVKDAVGNVVLTGTFRVAFDD